ncbi:hypothetical protein F5Y02DRAFT_384240 [Annulohypoxylon stygium]|nr:hypothetical protein F5Y02DRAFT_384240 [Annulohypoxylon stygium]
MRAGCTIVIAATPYRIAFALAIPRCYRCGDGRVTGPAGRRKEYRGREIGVGRLTPSGGKFLRRASRAISSPDAQMLPHHRDTGYGIQAI